MEPANLWRRKSFREDPDEPRAWEALANLYAVISDGTPREVLWEGRLEPLLKATRSIDQRGLLIATEEEMYKRLQCVLDWCRDVLGLEECDGWEQDVPRFLKELLQGFYQEAGGCIAYVVIESCRDLLRNRLTDYREMPNDCETPAYLGLVCEGNRVPIPLLGRVRLPLRGLRWEVPWGRSAVETSVVDLPLTRTIELVTRTAREPLQGFWKCWCPATRGEDDRLLERGAIPAGLQSLITENVNGARLMTFIRLDYLCNTESFAIDVNPTNGRVISIRYVYIPLKMLVALDPWHDDWLRQLIHQPQGGAGRTW